MAMLFGIDPLHISSGSHRVTRGGSWGDDAYYLRSAYRYSDDPRYRSSEVGLRLARTL